MREREREGEHLDVTTNWSPRGDIETVQGVVRAFARSYKSVCVVCGVSVSMSVCGVCEYNSVCV